MGLVTKIVGDEVVPLIIPFVEENISKADWRRQETATYAFQSILEGPSPSKLTHLISIALSSMLNTMKEKNNYVNDTIAWTFERLPYSISAS